MTGEIALAGPLVSVVVAAYNRERFLPEALASILGQSYPHWEAIVVDDGSTDGTRAYLDALPDPRIHPVYVAHCGSPGKLRNIGIERARGDLVAFLDSDDVWLPEKLALQVEDLGKHDGCAWSYTDFTRMDVGGADIPFARPGEPEWRPYRGWILEELASLRALVVTPTVLAERRLLVEVGGFDESFVLSEDYDLWFRLAARAPASVVARPLTRIRHHGTSFTKTNPRLFDDWIRACTKLMETSTSPAVRVACLRNCAKAHLGQAAVHRRARAYRAAFRSLRAAAELDVDWWAWGASAAKTLIHPLVPGPLLRSYWRHRELSDPRRRV